jgi:tetratricopeptide (TPR) repeat protein
MVNLTVVGFLFISLASPPSELVRARDRQDVPSLQAQSAKLADAAGKSPNDAGAQYRLALADSYLAEVAQELGDKAAVQKAAEAGIVAAERAVALQGNVAEHHRILGTLCGQAVPAGVLLAVKYAKCASASIHQALELDPKSSMAYIGQGVGNYYLPAAFGGGVELAIRDFQKAVQLDPKSPEAYLWLGIASRKAGRNAEARAALQKAVDLSPERVWARKQLEKTPAK